MSRPPIDLTNKRIIINKTMHIGDVVIALPLLVLLKRMYPSCYIIYLGHEYTREMALQSTVVDDFVGWESLEVLSDEGAAAELAKLQADVILHIYAIKRIAYLAKKAKIPYRVGTNRRFHNWLYANHKI